MLFEKGAWTPSGLYIVGAHEASCLRDMYKLWLTCFRHALGLLHTCLQHLFSRHKEDSVAGLRSVHHPQFIYQEAGAAVHVLPADLKHTTSFTLSYFSLLVTKMG